MGCYHHVAKTRVLDGETPPLRKFDKNDLTLTCHGWSMVTGH